MTHTIKDQPISPNPNMLVATFKRDLQTSWRQKGDMLTPLFFFLVVASLFPLAIGPEPAILKKIGAGIVWVAALLATILSLPRLFTTDYQDGSLEQIILAPTPLWLVVHAKVAVHIFTTALPLVLITPFLGLQFALEQESLKILVLSLAIGLPTLSYLGAIGAALTLGIRGGGVLLAVLILPLYIPVLVFGSGAVDAFTAVLGISAHFAILAALFLITTFFGPFAVSAALKISME